MNWADWSIVGIVALSALISLSRGFVKEALSLVIWVGAIVVAFLFNDSLQTLLVSHIDVPSVRQVVAFSLLFIVTLILGGLINHLIGELVKMTGLSGTDRLLGMVFGVMRGIILVLALLIMVPAIIPIDQDPWYLQSRLIPELLKLEGWATDMAKQTMALIEQLINQ
ncbi:MAG: CvpA family protein [Pseudomonadales bacterium]